MIYKIGKKLIPILYPKKENNCIQFYFKEKTIFIPGYLYKYLDLLKLTYLLFPSKKAVRMRDVRSESHVF
ncbi:hypothetical protein GCM10025857_66740 [Alicyclobacillus contaminans]|nr:hypothetical protein GCM10025857_40220 [Alicyclobacillus contaminans]GMA55254.1 hypothetical protein GCM10025857_66110 [Alicyclobacillus contaminans]GMA55317.1 hypothetical protein GCM10025857_66740 [Alicyclobacillus contaminans]